jgi:hypothetical protein
VEVADVAVGLADNRYASPLTLQMAALAAVYGATSLQASTTRYPDSAPT